MKVLILSCDTGQGHNSAAHAVEEALQRKGVFCKVLDPLIFGGKHAAGLVSGAYTGIMKLAPRAFGAVYGAGALYSNAHLPSPIYHANARYAQKLGDYILREGYTAVVCTHLYPMEAMTALRRRPGFHVPAYGVLTDYTCIPFLREVALDGYFIPQEDLRRELVGQGLPSNLIFPTGIPVSGKFNTHLTRAEARKRLGLPQTAPMVLIMSGGIGCGYLAQLCEAFLKRSEGPFTACVLVGRNRQLKAELDARFGNTGRIRTVLFTTQVNVYMDAAEVLISKPGGLSSTEAAVANIPLVHLLAYGGCETKNALFFARRGMSLRAETVEQAVDGAWRLMKSPARAEQMRQAQRRYIPAHGAEEIAERVTGHG